MSLRCAKLDGAALPPVYAQGEIDGAPSSPVYACGEILQKKLSSQLAHFVSNMQMSENNALTHLHSMLQINSLQV